MPNDPGQRLIFLESELSAYRAENDRLARELALARRLMGRPPESALLRLPRAACAGDDIIFRFDRCETGDRLIHLVGWAFCPRVDCGQASLSLLLEGVKLVFVVKPEPVVRPDVAAAHAQADFGPAWPIGAAARSRLAQSGFAALLERAPLGAKSEYAVAIQIDGPDFSVRKPTGLVLHG